MKRNIFAYLLLLSLCLSGKEMSFPLEWNTSYSTALSYEVEIDRKRLAEIAGTAENTGFEVVAIANGKETPLKTVLHRGALKNTTSLRFTVPEGTASLLCRAVGKGELSEIAESQNIFANVLSANAAAKRTPYCFKNAFRVICAPLFKIYSVTICKASERTACNDLGAPFSVMSSQRP